MNNYSNNKLHDSHGYKEEVKIKYDAVKAVVGRFPNGTAAIMELLGAKRPALDWVAYCVIPPADQLVWEVRGNDLNKARLFLINL